MITKYDQADHWDLDYEPTHETGAKKGKIVFGEVST